LTQQPTNSAPTWRRIAYLLATLPVGVFWFTSLWVLLAVGLSLAVLWIGLPILRVALQAVRAGADAERRFLGWGLGISLPAPVRSDAGQARWWSARLADPTTWRDAIYLMLLLPLGVVWFSLVMISLVIPLALLAVPVTYRLFPSGQFSFVSSEWRWVVVDSLPKALLFAVIGVLLVVLVPRIVRGIAGLHRAMAAQLLGPNTKVELETQVRNLRVARDRGLEAAEFERSRIERNLHDGAQPRLVALAMELGQAKEKMGTDPEAAMRLIDRAHEHAKLAMAELRDLARGIHPAVLTDRGLDAALSALAGQSPVPVDVTNNLTDRLPPPIESAAYFVAAEALTNAAKHSGASRVGITIDQSGEQVVVEVTDNGVGGAHPTGSGLRGLADRVGAVGGTLEVESPPGGPTTVRAELPCE
jgi:signal transduction histidine kinase